MIVAQLIIEIITFIILLRALFVNINKMENKATFWLKFKVFAIAASFVTFIFYFKVLAQYSFLFMMFAILTIGKNKKQDDNKINDKLDYR